MLEVKEISHSFPRLDGPPVIAVEELSLSVPKGRFVSLLGQSGCGKSTLFNVIAGLMRPTQGQVVLDGREITGRAGLVSYMLQKDLLLPWRTVLDNVILGLELRGIAKASARERAGPVMERYGLAGFERQYPQTLSGGMRQRAALLRTLLCENDVILLDEPFAALDAQTRLVMQRWLLRIWSDFGSTVLFVTHDVDEAIFLSDEIYVLSPRPGRIAARFDVEIGRPRDTSVVSSPTFVDLKRRCLSLLFEGAEPGALEHAA